MLACLLAEVTQLSGKNRTSQAAMGAVYCIHDPELKLNAGREMGEGLLFIVPHYLPKVLLLPQRLLFGDLSYF